MQTLSMIDPTCIIGAVLGVVFVGALMTWLVDRQPDACETGASADDDTPTTDGEPRGVPDSVITVYAPGHLPALGYVVVSHTPAHGTESEARND